MLIVYEYVSIEENGLLAINNRDYGLALEGSY
jgi:hypothetical protein